MGVELEYAERNLVQSGSFAWWWGRVRGCPDCGNDNAMVTAEGFLGVEPICVSDVFGECEIGTCVSGNRVSNAGWVCGVRQDG